jgi:hypothetical protein
MDRMAHRGRLRRTFPELSRQFCTPPRCEHKTLVGESTQDIA